MDLLLCFASLCTSAQEEEADEKLTRDECTVSTWTTNNLFTLTLINSELVTVQALNQVQPKARYIDSHVSLSYAFMKPLFLFPSQVT